MKTKIITISPQSFSPDELREAADLIRSGSLVAFPTETVYGLGANAFNGAACDRIFEAKGRPHDNPLIVHVYSPEDCKKLADTESSPLFWKLADRFMPGPLTIILPKREIIPDSVTVGLSTVALRCPSHPVARELIRLSGVPVAAPSANLSGRPSPTSAEHVIEDMSGKIPMILDGGEADVGLESTVISLKNDVITLLRPGFVTVEDLRVVTERIEISPAVLKALTSTDRPESPGMKYRHYAPKSPVTMVNGTDAAVIRFLSDRFEDGCGILCFEEDLSFFPADPRVISLGNRLDLRKQAHTLFDALRRFDSFDLPHIYTRYTETDHLGLAISNRLLRACAFDVLNL